MTTFSRDVELTPAYILHSRKFRETSLILDLFTARDGRVSAIYKGARKKKTGSVQPFTPMLISLYGRNDLKTISKLESGYVQLLAGDKLLIGLYVNELLVRLLGKHEAHALLFANYQQLITSLGSDPSLLDNQVNFKLREFEICLLNTLGYGIDFNYADNGRHQIEPECYYHFNPSEGFYTSEFKQIQLKYEKNTFKGELLLAVSRGEFLIEDVNKCAKQIIRKAVDSLLEGKKLMSRDLFRQYQSQKKPEIE